MRRNPIFQVMVFCVFLAFRVSSVCGDETWTRHTIDQTLQGADGVRLGDFNGDQLPDIVSGWEESGVVRLYLHPGHARSKKPWPAVTVGKGKSPEDAVPLDIDGDGLLEVVSCHEGKLKRVFVHRFKAKLNDDKHLLRSTNWESKPLEILDGQQWMFAAPIKLNGGRSAMVLGSKNKGATLTLLKQDKPGQPIEEWTVKKIRQAGWVMSIQVIDMDADGDSDIVFSDRKGVHRGIGWLEQPDQNKLDKRKVDNQTWQEHSIGGKDNAILFIEAAPSRVLASTRNSVWIEYKKTFGDNWVSASMSNPKDVVNGKAIRSFKNGAIVLTANTAAARPSPTLPGIWLKPSGQQWQVIDRTTQTKFDRIELIDIDGDGDLDILTCEERRQLGVVWYENPEN